MKLTTMIQLVFIIINGSAFTNTMKENKDRIFLAVIYAMLIALGKFKPKGNVLIKIAFEGRCVPRKAIGWGAGANGVIGQLVVHK